MPRIARIGGFDSAAVPMPVQIGSPATAAKSTRITFVSARSSHPGTYAHR
jgi:hypothetical protein